MDARPKVLVVDDEPAVREILAALVERIGCRTIEAESGEAALAVLDREACDVVVLDLAMPGIGGLETLKRIKAGSSLAEVILATASADVGHAVEGSRAGALDYVLKPFRKGEIESAVRRALEKRRAERSSAAITHFVERGSFFPDIVGDSPAIREVVRTLAKIAPTDCTVLIEGETGTGKELLAREIHRQSRRAAMPFVSLNCAGLPEALLESELFGHEKGAFTGAAKLKRGILEVADGGTLFLDEVGEMSPGIQARLLRVLENGEMRRVGGNAILTTDVRIVAATNRQMRQEVAEGRFREDLFYRLNTVVLRAPSLRERREDIPFLAEYFMQRITSGRPKRFSPEAMKILQAHPWPGNVRELRNTIERFAILAEGPEILPKHCPMDIPGKAAARGEDGDLPLEEVERKHILRVLERHRGNKQKAARILGLSKATLYSKLRKYDVPLERSSPTDV